MVLFTEMIKIDDERKIEEYTFREGGKGIMGFPDIKLMKKLGIFEREIARRDFFIPIGEKEYRIGEIEKLEIEEVQDFLVFRFTKKDEESTLEFKKE